MWKGLPCVQARTPSAAHAPRRGQSPAALGVGSTARQVIAKRHRRLSGCLLPVLLTLPSTGAAAPPSAPEAESHRTTLLRDSSWLCGCAASSEAVLAWPLPQTHARLPITQAWIGLRPKYKKADMRRGQCGAE